MPNIKYKNKTLFYRRSGNGIPLILIHGFCEDSSMWNEFKKAFSNCKIICPDLPGFGNSSLPHQKSIHYYAMAVKAILNKEKVKKCIMIGHSMGGYVSLAFAEKYPTQLVGMGLFHSHPFADTDIGKDNRHKGIAFIDKFGHKKYVEGLMPKLFPPKFKRSPILKKLIAKAAQYSASSIKTGLQAMADRPDRSSVLAQSTYPVLIIAGKEDQVIPFDLSAQFVHLPAVASVHLLEGIGHMGMFEDAANTSAIIKEFIYFCS